MDQMLVQRCSYLVSKGVNMQKLYFLSRIGWYIIAFVLIITLNFFLVRFMPGDHLIHLLGELNYRYLYIYEPEALEVLKAKYGLDRPLSVQYYVYVAK